VWRAASSPVTVRVLAPTLTRQGLAALAEWPQRVEENNVLNSCLETAAGGA
jgi:hypothetical protein